MGTHPQGSRLRTQDSSLLPIISPRPVCRRGNARMSQPSFANRSNLDLIEDYYRRWKTDPSSLDERWRAFFEGFELASGRSAEPCDTAQTGVVRMVYVYRNAGHLQAHLDPL